MQDELAMKTTIVGSFPLDSSDANVKRITKDLVEIGLDIINFPQLEDMHSMYLDPLVASNGLKKQNNLYFIPNDFSPPKKPASTIIRPVKLMMEVLQDLEMPVFGRRGCVTGPFTLMTHMRMEDVQQDSPFNIVEVIQKHPKQFDNIVKYVNMIAREYSQFCDIVSIDEPILGLLVGGRKTLFDLQMKISTDEAIDLMITKLNQAIKGINAVPSIHVCGVIPPLLRDVLLKTNVRIVDHEFRSAPENFELFKRDHLEANDKILAFGSIQTIYGGEGAETFVESVEDIRNWIQKGIDSFGAENILIKPDCGFMPLKGAFPDPYQIVMKKLQNMINAVNLVSA